MTKEPIHPGTATSGVPRTAPAGGGHHDDTRDARRRAARLDTLLGDPFDPANPHGLRALLAADDAREPPHVTEELLTSRHTAAEFVPLEHGGRLTRADLLVTALRPVFRRDLTLGFGFGITSLFAVSAVWAAGTPQQRRQSARLLLGGGRATIVHHHMAHANAVLRDELRAHPAPGGGFRLEGRKDAVINAARADSHVVYARTGAPDDDPHSHSVLLLDPAALPADRVRHHPRLPQVAPRGAHLSGIEFLDCPVPPQALVGRQGEGIPLAVRTVQVNRALVSGLVIGTVDTVLHATVRAALTGGRTRPARRWHTPLTGVFADLLACDAMATAALRSLSLFPAQTHATAAAVKYVVPDLLRECLSELQCVLGSAGPDPADPAGEALGRLVRDLPAAGLGHAGAAACQAVIIPQLPSLARHSWFTEPEPPPELFRPAARLPHLDYRLLGIAESRDVLTAALTGAATRLADTHDTPGPRGALARLAKTLVGELRALHERCRTLPPPGTATRVHPSLYALSARYALVAAAGAVLATWEAQDGSDPFLSEPAWAVLALTRLAGRLGLTAGEPPESCRQQVLQELVRRCRTATGYDLAATPCPW
ncbi:acyl-CoA dehydrogenase [Streptomyces sp. NRRL F-5727]|uniref:acyl-CoA dehydrogenase n=1 Tax=Streptomyces sp. NRRL F-5727 TaxID=1463871 RepID=UPI00068BC16B|nr:acyl-CoA dehydrogenase [Streptomyces sp. NRRL F-5727]